MTTTSVKDVGSVMNPGIRTGSAASKSGADTFQTVWNSQTDANRSPKQDETANQKDRVDGRANPGDDLRAKDSSRKELRSDDNDKVKETGDGMTQDEISEEDLERAMEAAAAAVMDLIGQIADTFGMSVESVEKLMADMNLQPMDLLQQENLSNLLLEAGGAQDSLALLTNEQLCLDYQALMAKGQAALDAVSDETGIVPQQILQTADELRPAEEPDAGLVPEDGAGEDIVGIADANGAEIVQTTPKSGGSDAGDSADAKDAKHDGDAAASHTGGSQMFQMLRSESFQPQAGAVEETASPWDADTQDIMRQIMDYMRLQVKPDMSSLEMQLHPANLGTLQIHVASKGGMLTASFVTQNEAVRAALESQMVQLKENFEQQGVKVEAIEVTVQTHQFEQNLEQGRGRQPQQTTEGRRPRVRRIHLGGSDGADIPETLEAEERIAAEVMAANGGTVDFTA